MISASDGSPRDPKKFLEDYANKVELGIQDLQGARQTAPGDVALRGKVGQTIKDRYGTEITI
jgi:hypothetical protein